MGIFDFFKKTAVNQPDPKVYDVSLYTYVGDSFLKYYYKNVPFNNNSGDYPSGNAEISIYDNIVNIGCSGQIIGSLTDPKITQMILDFFKKSEAVIAKFDSPNTVKIGFYINYKKKYSDRPYKIYSLKGQNKKSIISEYEKRSEIIGTCKDWTPITFEEYENKIIAYLPDGDDIGELSKSDAKKIGNYESADAFIINLQKDIDDNFEEHYSCNVAVIE